MHTRNWIHERYHESSLGIDTAGCVGLQELGITEFQSTSTLYQPIPYGSILGILKSIPIRPNYDVFLDYGSGKGRAIVAAAMFPFKRVIGLDRSLELNRWAEANVAKTRAHLRASRIEVVTADAAQYELPDDVSVIFMYNPFFGKSLLGVIRQMVSSLERRRRTVKLIYVNPAWNPDLFLQRDRFRLVLSTGRHLDEGEVLRLYEAS